MSPDVLGGTVIAFCCVTCCGSSVNDMIVVQVAASLVPAVAAAVRL